MKLFDYQGNFIQEEASYSWKSNGSHIVEVFWISKVSDQKGSTVASS